MSYYTREAFSEKPVNYLSFLAYYYLLKIENYYFKFRVKIYLFSLARIIVFI